MRGIYSESQIIGDLFIKNYDEKIFFVRVMQEFYKSQKIYELREKGGYNFPKPLMNHGNTIISEALKPGMINLEEFLYKNNNNKHQDLTAIKRIMRRCGTILGTIHKELKLDIKDSLGWNIAPQHKAFLYTDFGLKSILIKGDEITLIDPSFTIITDKVCLYDSIYYDLAYFIFSINYLIPLKHRPTYLFNNNESFIREFLLFYQITTGYTLTPVLLERFEDKIKEKYLTTIDKGWKGKIWRKIINEPNKFYKGNKVVRDFQGTPWQYNI